MLLTAQDTPDPTTKKQVAQKTNSAEIENSELVCVKVVFRLDDKALPVAQ